jgi:iron complex transport system substrate-binding protein
MRSALFLVLLFAEATHAHADVRVTDDAGHVVRLAGPAKRIISLAPSVTEMVFEAGGGDRLVGTVDYSDYPAAARRIPRVGSNQQLDLERIASLRPDLVLVWFHDNATREVEQLSTLGLPMFHVEPRRIEDVPGALERIGQLLDTRAVADAAAKRFRDRHADLRARYAGRAQVGAFYQIAESPLLTISDKQIISDVIRLCGGRNVFGSESAIVPQVSTESVVTANPDVILAAALGERNVDGVLPVRAPGDPSFSMWKPFSTMKAVRAGQMWLIPANIISRPGPRILDGVEAVCRTFDEARKFPVARKQEPASP